MKINLKLRSLTAYCSPCKIILADNEEAEINIIDRGQLKGKAVLLFNGKSYIADKEKIVTIPRKEIQSVNVLELTEQDETGKVTRRFVTDNLYAMEYWTEYGGNRLLTERAFYQKTLAELLKEVQALADKQTKLEKRQADLENGKYTMFKFGGTEQ